MQAPNNILIVITRRIGDVLLTTPLIRSLKAYWPEAMIDVIAFSGSQGVLANNPDIRKVITIEERPTLWQHLCLFKNLYKEYDLSISTLSGDRPTLYAALASKHSLGLVERKKNQRWKDWLLTQSITFDGEHTHTVSMYLALAKALGVPQLPQIGLHWNVSQINHVCQFIDIARPFAVLHIYPKFAYKMWHHLGWVTLSKWLTTHDYQIVLTGSNDPDEMQYLTTLSSQLPRSTINLSGKLSLPETAFLVSKAAIYIGTDTSISHVAAAAGTPTVVLFGPTNTVKWGPWPKDYPVSQSPYQMKGTQIVGNVTLIQGEGLCVPCHKAGCEDHNTSRSDCLQHMKAETVIAQVAQRLNLPVSTYLHD